MPRIWDLGSKRRLESLFAFPLSEILFSMTNDGESFQITYSKTIGPFLFELAASLLYSLVSLFKEA